VVCQLGHFFPASCELYLDSVVQTPSEYGAVPITVFPLKPAVPPRTVSNSKVCLLHLDDNGWIQQVNIVPDSAP
jgi:hypothetical protein